jgi:hypothetical protein
MAWKMINGRRVKIRSTGRKRRSHHEPRSSDGFRFIFGSSKTPAERERIEREKARERIAKAKLKAIRRESKAEASAIRKVGKERAKEARLRVQQAAYAPSPEGQEG